MVLYLSLKVGLGFDTEQTSAKIPKFILKTLSKNLRVSYIAMADHADALDDAIALLDTIISRLRAIHSSNPGHPTSLQAPTQKEVAEKERVSQSEKPPVSHETQPTISSGEAPEAPANGPDLSEDFDKAHLQVGCVVSVDDHPVAEKLYVCKVEIAKGEFKQVVAGLRKFIPSSELLGKKVCLVLNLKPAKLAGQLSEAMILAGEASDINTSLNVKVLQPPLDASVGDRIYLEGSGPSTKPAKQLSSKIWEKLAPLLSIHGGIAKFNKRFLVTSSGVVTAPDLPDGASIH